MKLLDLFCGAGGAAMGYHRAGFDEIVGIDIEHQANYPFDFIQADALEMSINYSGFDLIHSSPPCQRCAMGTPNHNNYPDLITTLRKLLLKINQPYVIENVRRAPIRSDARVCGCQVGLKHIRRVRHFEIHPPRLLLSPSCQHTELAITVTGHGTPTGNLATWGRGIGVAEKREAMGIDWMTRSELSQAIPPAYTEWIGRKIVGNGTP